MKKPMKKTILLLAAMLLLVSAVPALAQTVDEPRRAEEELVPWTPETGYSVIEWYERQVDARAQYSAEPRPGYVDFVESGTCWYDPNDAYIVGADGAVPAYITPCGTIM
jgi:hypothetical protein